MLSLRHLVPSVAMHLPGRMPNSDGAAQAAKSILELLRSDNLLDLPASEGIQRLRRERPSLAREFAFFEET